jgi:hypothetical protein
MYKYLYLIILSLFLAGCSSGISPMSRKQLSAKQTVPVRPLVTNVVEKEIVFIKPAQQIKIKKDLTYTNAFSEPVIIPIEISITQEPTTNSFRFEGGKYVRDNSFWLSGNFLLLYYGTAIGIGLGIWFFIRRKNKLTKS